MEDNFSDYDEQHLYENLLNDNEDETYITKENLSQINQSYDNSQLTQSICSLKQIKNYINDDQKYLKNQNINLKNQPFISTIVKDRLLTYLKNDGYINLKDYEETIDHIIMKGFSKKYDKDIFLQIIRTTNDDYKIINNIYQKFINIDTLQYVQKYYSVLFYPDLFLSVIIQDIYEHTLQQELSEINQQNQNKKYQSQSYQQYINIIFQLTHSLTEIHSYNIIHYYINPKNIIKTSIQGNYKLTNFHKILILKNKQICQINFSDIKYIPYEGQLCLNDMNFKIENITNKIDVYSTSVIILDILKFNNNHYQSISNNNIEDNVQQINNQNISQSLSENNINNISDDDMKYLESILLVDDYEKRKNSHELFKIIYPYLQISKDNIHKILKYLNRSLKIDVLSGIKNQSYLKLLRLSYSEIRLQLLIQQPQKVFKIILDAFQSVSINFINNKHYIKGIFYSVLSIFLMKSISDYNHNRLIPNNLFSFQTIIDFNLNNNNNTTNEELNNFINKFIEIKEGKQNNINNNQINVTDPQSIIQYCKLDKINIQTRIEIVQYLLSISQCYNRLKQQELSLQYALESYKLSDELKKIDLLLFAKSTCRLSWCYINLKNGQLAKQYSYLSLSIYIELNKKKYKIMESEALTAVACAHEILDHLDVALSYFQQSLKIRKENLNQKNPLIAEAYYCIGLIHEKQQNYQLAYDNFVLSNHIYNLNMIKFKTQSILTLNKLEQCYKQLKKSSQQNLLQQQE